MQEELVIELLVIVILTNFVFKSDVDECASMPCQNNGTCVDDINRFTCDCISGFMGRFCETSKTFC